MFRVDVALVCWKTTVLVAAVDYYNMVGWQDMVYKMIPVAADAVAEQEREPTQHPVHRDTMMLQESVQPQITTCRILHSSLQNGEIPSKHRVFVAK